MTSFTTQAFNRTYFILFVMVFSLFLANPLSSHGQSEELPTSEEALSQGEELFRNNCANCHAIHEQVIGPALVNVTDRRPIPWLINFIHNSQKVIQSGDEYAVNLFNEYGKTVMTSFDYFSEDEIKSILSYIEAESDITPAERNNVAEVSETPEMAANNSNALPSSYLGFIFSGFFVVMILVLVVMILMIIVLKKFINQ